jgi:uncharacterized protein YlzI (FlbEa/FlbD family)
MKQIIIFLLIIIAALIGYGKYSDYKRYNSPETAFQTTKNIDVNYHDKKVVFDYYNAVEDLNSYVMLQWTTNGIDVRTPEDDAVETKAAVKTYADKKAKIAYYEALLEQSKKLKEKGLSNAEIQFLEVNGMNYETQKKNQRIEKIKSLFNTSVKLYNGEKNAIVYEVQKELVKKGYDIQIDGVYRIETLNAIKSFEEKNNLLADGYLDSLTIELLFQ